MAVENPSSVTLSASGGIVTLSWQNNDGYTSVIIFRNTSNSSAGLTVISGAPTSYQDQPGSGTFYYWVRGKIFTPGWTDPETGIKYPAITEYSDTIASTPAHVTVSPPSAPSTPTMGALSTTSVP